MEIGRRELLSAAVALVLGRGAPAAPEEAQQMYGRIGSMGAAPGRRDGETNDLSFWQPSDHNSSRRVRAASH